MLDSWKRKFIVLSVCTTVFASAAVFPIWGMKAYAENLANDPKFDGLSERMLKTDSGVPLTLPLNDNPINVVYKNLTDEQKQLATEAINDLDDISENVNYTILDSDDVKITQKVVVTNIENLRMDNKAGEANIYYNNHTGIISYPIYVYIDPICSQIKSSINGENMYTTVLKHEMMHTLGFKDIYGRENRHNTIMYYSINSDDRALDYTPLDIKDIQQLYDNKFVVRQEPKSANFKFKSYDSYKTEYYQQYKDHVYYNKEDKDDGLLL